MCCTTRRWLVLGIIVVLLLLMALFPKEEAVNGPKRIESVTHNRVYLDDLIEVVSPVVSQRVESSFIVQGLARGYWYFEATFPIEIQDEQGRVLQEDFIMTGDDWMTEEFVRFEKEIVLNEDIPELFVVVFKRANPADLDRNNQEVRLPLLRKTLPK